MTTPTFTIETITPAIAEKYLSRNLRNRNKKPTKVARYAHDMRAGRWALTGEAIKFDTAGNLSDGQNRLMAVIESGSTIQTLVARNIAVEAQDVMDTGAARSGGDQLVIHGHANGKDLQAAFNAYHGWHDRIILRANDDLSGNTRLTNAEIVAYSKRYPEIENALPDAMRAKRHFKGFPIGALALAFHEFNKVDADDALEFFRRWEDMDFSGRGFALRTLTKRIAKDNEGKRASTRYKLGTALFMLFRTWNAFRDDERLERITTSAQGSWAAIPTPR